MAFPTDEWLETVNARLRAAGVPPSQRPWTALWQLNSESGRALRISDPPARRIFQWFHDVLEAGGGLVGPLFRGVYFHDDSFWPMIIPCFVGTRRLYPVDSLNEMPPKMLDELMENTDSQGEFIAAWADTVDYVLSVELLREGSQGPETAGFLHGADRELRAACSLLLGNYPRAKAGQASQFAVEMVAKWFLSRHAGLSAKALGRDFSHDIERLLRECSGHLAEHALINYQVALTRLPGVSARYTAEEPESARLWDNYRTALGVSAVLLRRVTGQNCRG